MINIRTFFTSIPQFFHLLWASIVALFIFQEKEDQLPGDIEAAIPTSNVVGGLEKETVTEPTKDVQSDTRFLVPPTAGFVEIDLKNNRNINYDHPSRRPSRRISAVDPVKSRIVDAALKQVQDKTINVIKTVVLTPCTVIAIPCSAKIEYYDPRTENRGVQFGLMKNRPNFKKRAVQFGEN
ncbi:hypothetical protein BDZ97DRAFT_591109 [Flammula alnicola]|nr:hypothetical protein BDZ97DRAFT_591109 [Flammula alnicola]